MPRCCARLRQSWGFSLARQLPEMCLGAACVGSFALGLCNETEHILRPADALRRDLIARVCARHRPRLVARPPRALRRTPGAPHRGDACQDAACTSSCGSGARRSHACEGLKHCKGHPDVTVGRRFHFQLGRGRGQDAWLKAQLSVRKAVSQMVFSGQAATSLQPPRSPPCVHPR